MENKISLPLMFFLMIATAAAVFYISQLFNPAEPAPQPTAVVTTTQIPTATPTQTPDTLTKLKLGYSRMSDKDRGTLKDMWMAVRDDPSASKMVLDSFQKNIEIDATESEIRSFLEWVIVQ